MKIETYTLTPTDLQEAINAGKEELIDALAREGLLQNPEEIKAKYAIVIAHRNWLGRKIKEILGLPDDGSSVQFKVVKLA